MLQAQSISRKRMQPKKKHVNKLKIILKISCKAMLPEARNVIIISSLILLNKFHDLYSFRVIKFQLNYDWNKLCILLLPQIHMFLTGLYFFKFKHIFKKARQFGEPSFYFMLIRNILESALFAVFRLDTNCLYSLESPNSTLPWVVQNRCLVRLSVKSIFPTVSSKVFWWYRNLTMLLFYHSALVRLLSL